MKKSIIVTISAILTLTAIAAAAAFGFFYFKGGLSERIAEKKVYRSVASQLKMDSRKAELLITDVSFDGDAGTLRTNAKFTEYNANGLAMNPAYLTFNGTVIQIQSLVIRLDDIPMDNSRNFRGKKVYLFWKAFLPDGRNTKSEELSPMNEIPAAYKLTDAEDPKEEDIWSNIWNYAFDTEKNDNVLINNISIKTSEKIFIPGTLYTINIGSDGKMRSETSFLASRHD